MAFVVTAVVAEVVTVASIAAAVAELGMALSVIGAVTGSKDLVKIGGVLSIAGGVTSLAAGAMTAAEGAAVEGVADGAVDAGMGGYGAIDGVAEGAVDAGMGGYGALDTATDGALDVASLPDTGPMDMDMGYNGTPAPASTPAPTNAVTPDATATNPADAVKSSVNPVEADPYLNETAKLSQQSIAPPPSTDPFSMKQWWNGLDSSTKNTVMQMGGKAVGGMFQGWSEEQKQALDRDKFSLTQQQYNTSVSNANAQPGVTQYQVKPGIINAAMGAK